MKKPSVVMLEVCDKTYTITPKYIAVQQIGALLNKGPMKVLDDIQSHNWLPEELATVVFCMIQSKGTPNLQDIGEDMMGRYGRYIPKITEFLSNCMVGADEELEELTEVTNEDTEEASGGPEGN
jgi:hypothetical protein